MLHDLPSDITEADVRSLAAKLKGLHALLTPGEQALMQALLRWAAASCGAAPPDTGGYTWAVAFNPLPYLDSIATAEQRLFHSGG